MQIRIPKKLLPIFTSKHRYICIDGGRGGGKSWAAADYCLYRGAKAKTRILCVREVQNSIKDSVHKLLSDRIEYHKLKNFYTITEKSIKGRNGTEIIFKGLWNNDDDIKSTEGIDICWPEEAMSVSRSSLDSLIPTIRKEGSQIIFTYNATNETDPVHVDFKLADRDDILKITINYDENPFFPEVLRAEMEYCKRTNYDKYLHVWKGETLAHSEAQVFYGKWRVDTFETPGNIDFFYEGVDWGFAKDPIHAARFYVDDNRLWIDYEAYGVGVEIPDTPDLLNIIPDFANYPSRADSARPELISYCKNHGLPMMRPAVKGKGSIEDGIDKIKGFEEVVIHSRCKNMIDSFRLYSYIVDRKTGEISNKPKDADNHGIDLLRYGLEPLYSPMDVVANQEIDISVLGL